MNQTEKLVRQFLLESIFFGETTLSLYYIFKEKYHHFNVSYDQFREAFNTMCECFVDLVFSADKTQDCFESKRQISALDITEANIARLKINEQNLTNSVNAVFGKLEVGYRFSDLDFNVLYNSYSKSKDYVIYRIPNEFKSDQSHSIEYSVTAEELAKQVENARKEIEFYGKVAI